MTDPDLADAVQATFMAHTARMFECSCGENFGDALTLGEAGRRFQRHRAGAVLAQVRAQIAADIQDRADDLSSTGEVGTEGYVNGLDDAVRITRGES